MGSHEEYSATDLQTEHVQGMHYEVVTRLIAPLSTRRDGRYVLKIDIPEAVQDLQDTYLIRPRACRGALG